MMQRQTPGVMFEKSKGELKEDNIFKFSIGRESRAN